MTRAHLNGQSTDDRILLALKRGPLREYELSARLSLNRQTVGKALARLLHEVEREPVPGHPRYRTYRLSAVGQQRVDLLECLRKQA